MRSRLQIDESSTTKLRDRFNVGKDDFRVFLIGKDGGVKRQFLANVQAMFKIAQWKVLFNTKKLTYYISNNTE